MKDIGKVIGNKILGYTIFFGIALVIGGIYNGGKYLVNQVKNHEKAVFFVNFYAEEIEVDVNGEKKTLGSSEGYTFYTEEQEVTVSAIKGEEEVLSESYSMDKKAYVIANILDGREQKQDCLIYANISDYFYSSSTLTDDNIYKVSKLSEKGFISKQLETDLDFKLTAFPGEYSGDDLPDEIDLSDMGLIRGVFPISCEILDDADAIQTQIEDYLYFGLGGFDSYLEEELVIE